MARPDFTLKWAGSRLSIPAISAGNYAAGWDAYLGPLPPLGDDHDYVMNLQDSRAIWLGEQMLLAVGHEWQSDVTYDAYAITRSPVDGQLYRSLIAGNIGNEPSVSGAQWALGVADSADLLNAPIATVAAASTIDLTAGAPDTSQLEITGAGVSINGFTVAANRAFFVRFAGANTLVNSASLVTNTGGNIATFEGMTILLRATAENTVEALYADRFASNTEAQAGTAIDRAVTPGNLNSTVPGMGQTWQDVKASRAQNTTYTNTTGRPIMVSISTGTASQCSLVVDGLTASSVFVSGATGGNLSVGAIIVPAGSTYRFNSTSPAGAWLELR